jgi:hypothetical protein
MWTKRALAVGRSQFTNTNCLYLFCFVQASPIVGARRPNRGRAQGYLQPSAFLPGQVFDDNDQVIVKLGYDGSSTVWLAKDIRRYVFVVT